jgi:hypothetical protein
MLSRRAGASFFGLMISVVFWSFAQVISRNVLFRAGRDNAHMKLRAPKMADPGTDSALPGTGCKGLA